MKTKRIKTKKPPKWRVQIFGPFSNHNTQADIEYYFLHGKDKESETDHYEVSVIKIDNKYDGWGWGDLDKIILFSSIRGNQIRDHDPDNVEEAIKIANTICHALNNME